MTTRNRDDGDPLIPFTIDGTPYETSRPRQRAADLLRLAHLDPREFDLVQLLGRGRRRKTYADTDRVEITKDARFVSQSASGTTRIIVSGRRYEIQGHVVSYDEIVRIWNELHAAENIHIIGTPGIDYEHSAMGKDGVLLPGRRVEVMNGTSFSVDPEHVS